MYSSSKRGYNRKELVLYIFRDTSPWHSQGVILILQIRNCVFRFGQLFFLFVFFMYLLYAFVWQKCNKYLFNQYPEYSSSLHKKQTDLENDNWKDFFIYTIRNSWVDCKLLKTI